VEERWEVHESCYQVECVIGVFILEYSLLIVAHRETVAGSNMLSDSTAQA
jgi:hypothetical protein